MSKKSKKAKKVRKNAPVQPVRELSHREINYRAWQRGAENRKLLFSATESMGSPKHIIWYWYDDGTVISTALEVDDNGNETILYNEVMSPNFKWNAEDFGDKIYPKEVE